MFFYICYHNERFPGTQNGPAEASYDANPKESIRTFWSDETIERDTNGIITSPFRKDGGMLARTGRPKRLPKWLSEADLEYVTKQFKHSGFRGGVNYYRNIGRNWHNLMTDLPRISKNGVEIIELSKKYKIKFQSLNNYLRKWQKVKLGRIYK